MIHAIQDGVVRLSSVLPTARRWGGPDILLRSCCSDAGQVRPGDVYVALIHADGDGHDDLDRAVQQGAVAAVVERPLAVAIPQYVVEDTREAYGRLCQQIAGQPTRHLHTIGVTGSHGKTSVTLLLASILKAAGHQPGTSHSLGWSDSAHFHPGDFARASSPELARQLSEMVVQGCDAAVLELSSQSLAERRPSGIAWDTAVITNIRREHINWHGNVRNYRQAKLRLLQELDPDGTAVVNLDDPATSKFIQDLRQRVVTFGLNPEADVSAMVVERHRSEQIFLLNVRQHSAAVRTRIIGEAHLSNCLAAAAVALSLGVPLDRVVRGLEAVESLPGRWERLECGQPFGVYVDGSDSPDRLSSTLRMLRGVTKGRLICVYGPDGMRPTDERPLFGRAVEQLADVGVVTANNPGSEPFLQIAHDVLDGYRHVARDRMIPDRRRAIAWALREAGPDDVVLVAGKGEMSQQDLGNQVIAWDERETIQNELYHLDDPNWNWISGTSTDDECEPVILPIR
jgi:UDP-N-acetylmuramoyl-L-alanyl-D-glutamate--2,6-diaminopimelate ligase